MSLISIPNGDGTSTITVDFCYYLKTPAGRPKNPKPYQKWDREGAERAARAHLQRFPSITNRIEHDSKGQCYLAIYIRRDA